MAKEQEKFAEKSTPFCGLVMPISAIDGCTEQHWSDVKEIITEAVELAGFKANRTYAIPMETDGLRNSCRK